MVVSLMVYKSHPGKTRHIQMCLRDKESQVFTSIKSNVQHHCPVNLDEFSGDLLSPCKKIKIKIKKLLNK